MNEKERDPGRMERVLQLLHEIWKSNPNVRFFQLMDSLKHEYSTENNGIGKREGFEMDSKGYKMPIAYIDLFYLEDKEFEEFLGAFNPEKR